MRSNEQRRSNHFVDLSDSKYEALESDNLEVLFPPPPLPLASPSLKGLCCFPSCNLSADLKLEISILMSVVERPEAGPGLVCTGKVHSSKCGGLSDSKYWVEGGWNTKTFLPVWTFIPAK